MQIAGMQTCRRMLVPSAISAAPRQRPDALQHCPAQRQVLLGRHERCHLSARAAGDEAEASTPSDQPSDSSSSSGAAATGLIDPAATPADAEPRPDDVLPDSLTDALEQAAASTLLALQSGATRCIAEVLLAEFWDPASGAVFSEEGDQQRFWKLTRRFVEGLAAGGAAQPARVKVLDPALQGLSNAQLYPDIGVAAMLRNQWQDVAFRIGSLGDRAIVAPDDEVVVLAAPDPQGLSDVLRVLAAAEDRSIVMFNPRLASGDVGIGLNVRRMQTQLLGSFTTAYSIRPVGDVGSVFRRYPEPWKVFVEDQETLGRYVLAAERETRPAGEALDAIVMDALGIGQPAGEDGSGPGFLTQLSRTVGSMQRFMKQLAN